MERLLKILNDIILFSFNRNIDYWHKAKLKSMFFTTFKSLSRNYMFKRLVWSFLACVLFISPFSINAQLTGCKTVVIDAGHGGKDPGCSGKKSKEKTVCLGIALKLGKLIEEKYKDVNVIYTRKSDKFIELDERAKIANKNKADLFICIHANANNSAKPRGAETYVLGLHKTDDQKAIANRENAVIELESGNKDKYKKLTPDMLIARTMQLSVYLNQSIIFANNIQKEFKAIGRYNRGVKQAGFVVLYKTTMPSVLIETGFLTNPSDEKFLYQKEGQEKMAKGIFNAFVKYKTDRDKVAEVVAKDEGGNTAVKKEQKVTFKIQLASSGNKIETASYNFKGLKGVERKKIDRYYRYFYGETSSYKAVKKSLAQAKKKGYKDAFVLAFSDGNRISLKKAINLASN